MFNYNLTSLISGSKCELQIICLRGFTFTSSRKASVSWHQWGYLVTHAIAPFHYIMAKNVPAMHLAAYA